MDSNQDGKIERRRHKRYPVHVPVRIYLQEKSNQPLDGKLRDISISGAFIECELPLHRGSKLVLEFRMEKSLLLPSIVTEVNKEIDTTLPPGVSPRAVIRWAERNKGFGVEFLNLDAEKAGYIQKLIAFLDAREKEPG